jgi:hypothetical protein
MAATALNVLSLAGSTPIGTGAYVQLTAAGGTPIPTTKLVIANGTNAQIQLAYGASSSEVALVAVAPTSSIVLDIGLNVLPVGVRLAVIALGSAASSGELSVSLMP